MADFMNQATTQGLQVDAVAFHWYGVSNPNDPTGGIATEEDFQYWRAHYGETLDSGSGSGSSLAPVPEPNSWILACISIVMTIVARRFP